MSYEKENLNVDQAINNNGLLINFKISIGICVGLIILFFAVLYDRTFLFDGLYCGAILFIILVLNSIIGITVNFIKRKARKNPYKILFFHAAILIASIPVVLVGCIATEVITIAVIQILELIKEATIELSS